MSAAEKKRNKSISYQSVISELFQELRGRLGLFDSSKLILVLCAAFCKHRQAAKFDGKLEHAHQYVSRLSEQSPQEFESSLKLAMELPPGSLARILESLETVVGSDEGLDVLWDIALQNDRFGGMTRFVAPAVSNLCVKIAGIKKTDRVLCPYTASFDFASYIRKTGASLTLQARDNALLGLLFREIFDHSVRVDPTDPMSRNISSESAGGAFDIVLASPPLSTRYDARIPDAQLAEFQFKTRHLEGLAIQQAITSAERKALVLVAPGITFRTTADERELKRYLVDSGKLEAVIKLPSGSFLNTKIPAMAFLLRGSNSPAAPGTLFVDASNMKIAGGDSAELQAIADIVVNRREGKNSRIVAAAEISEHQYNLEPGRYVLDDRRQALGAYLERSNHVALSEIAEILRPQVLTGDAESGRPVKEVGFSDIQADGIVVEPTKVRTLSPDAVKRAERFFLKSGDILLSVKGTVGRIALVEDAAGESWMPSQSFVVLRLDPREQRLTSKYLFYFLSSWAGQEQLDVAKGGSVVSIIQAQDVRDLRVVLPTKEAEERVAKTHSKISQLRKEIVEAERKILEMRIELQEAETGSSTRRAG